MTKAKEVVATRSKTHGNWSEQAAFSQTLKDALRSQVNWAYLPSTTREALEMTCVKISRILHGDAKHSDHWLDIQGYAELAVQSGDVLPLTNPSEPVDLPFKGLTNKLKQELEKKD